MKRIKRRESYFMICRVCQLNESRLHKFTYSTYFYCMIISYLFSHDLKDSPSFDIINGHHSEESRSFGSDPHSDQCIIIHVVILACVLLVGAKVLPGLLLAIIAMINRTINYGYDSRDGFNGPFGIIAMINSTVNHI